MKTLNKVQLIGNLGRDPELRWMPSGEAVVNLALATSSEWKDRESGDKQQHTDWHRCVAFGKLAELIAEYSKKGSTLYLEGKLRTRKWQDTEGHDVYTTEVIVDEFINMTKRPDDQAVPTATAQPAESPKPAAAKKSRSSKSTTV
jgi:single-strand DNA-binding protein